MLKPFQNIWYLYNDNVLVWLWWFFGLFWFVCWFGFCLLVYFYNSLSLKLLS